MKGERQNFLLRPPRGLESACQHSCVATNLVEMCHLLGENFLSWQCGYEHAFQSISLCSWVFIKTGPANLKANHLDMQCSSLCFSFPKSGWLRTWHTFPQVRDSNIQISITTSSWELLYSNHSITAFLCHTDTHKAERVMPSLPYCTQRAWHDISYCCLLLTIYRDSCIEWDGQHDLNPPTEVLHLLPHSCQGMRKWENS